jgi:hypothetical protein
MSDNHNLVGRINRAVLKTSLHAGALPQVLSRSVQVAHHNMQLLLTSLQQVMASSTDATRASSTVEAQLKLATSSLISQFSEVLEALQNPTHEFQAAQGFLTRVLHSEITSNINNSTKLIGEVSFAVHLACTRIEK